MGGSIESEKIRISLFTMNVLFMQTLHLLHVITWRVMTSDLSRLSIIQAMSEKIAG